ncbi:hypothetical protein V6N11_056768 [Hibiscus sabdariffa]|uniref:Uncharacterized protein n=1 Tax=Hibiscus sabdariffa TaxID=183260 RepID=A0ABR2T4T2_9ROSI
MTTLCRPVNPIKAARSSPPPVGGEVLHGKYWVKLSKPVSPIKVEVQPATFDDFSEDEENIMPVAEDDDIHLLDVDDVEAVMTDASEGNGLDVEDDVGAWLLLGLGWVG